MSLPLQRRIQLIALIPTILFVLACFYISEKAYRVSQSAAITIERVELLKATSALVASLQVERGTSASYLKGGASRSTLDGKRAVSDERLPEFSRVVEEQLQSGGQESERIRDAVLSARTLVDKNAAVPSAIGRYTTIVRDLLDHGGRRRQ